VNWAYLAHDGVSGGMLFMWDRRVAEKMEGFIGQYTVACYFKNVEENFLWAFASIYELNSVSNKRLLWEEIAKVHSWWDTPWCIGSDFNIIRLLSERSGESRMRPAIMKFLECIFYLRLVDLPLIGGAFTWSNICGLD